MDTGLLRELLEQRIKTLLLDRVMLHALGPLRYLCDEPLELVW